MDAHETVTHKPPHLVWIYSGNLVNSLDSSTRLEMTFELRKLGWNVTLISFGLPGKHIMEGVEYQSVPVRDRYFIKQVAGHYRVCKQLLELGTSVDFVFFSQLALPWMLLLKLRRFLRGEIRPLIVMDTRTLPMEDRDKMTLKDRLRGWFYLIMNWLANFTVDGQTAITARMAEHLHIPPKQLWGIWPSGADPSLFVNTSANRRMPQGDEPVELVYVGIMHRERNLLALCQAVEMANAEGMHFELSLVGDGNARPELEQFAAQTEGRVRVCRAVPHHEIPAILFTAHIGVLPFPDDEKYRVSSPIKLFEYLCAGLPILATRIVCHTDVIGNQRCIFWAESGSPESMAIALKQAWEKRANLGKMSAVSLRLSKGWTWKKSAVRLAEALLLGGQSITIHTPSAIRLRRIRKDSLE
jgi:glycosyltransferase involved in cell wall biosynthesis